jgi:predicted metal-dependent enzyme (double-stranded beta helix superfamily)
MVGKKRGYNTFHLTLASRGPTMKFDLDQLVSDCRKAVGENAPQAPISEILARSLSDRASLVSTLGEPKRAEMQKLYQGSDLTILNVIWAPWMTLLPHNHKMWAVIVIYTGREDNIFWRRLPADSSRRLEAAGAKALCEKDTVELGEDIIHSVTNPIGRLTGAIHIYGGDFFGVQRSEWDAETFLERACDGDRMARRFEQANTLLRRTLSRDA